MMNQSVAVITFEQYGGRIMSTSPVTPPTMAASLISGLIDQSKEILGGTPVFAGTRVPVRALFDYLEEGQSLNEFLKDFPRVTPAQALAFCASLNLPSTHCYMKILLDERGS